MSRKQKKRLGTILTVVAVIILILVLDIGLITNLLTAFKSPFTISSSPPKWIFKPTLDNFRNVLGKGSFDFRLYLWNSFVIAVISSAIAIALTIPAAYSIVRYHGLGDLILGSTMLLRLAPALAFAIPVFLIFLGIYIPIQIKFGAEKSRIAIFVIFGFVIVVTMMGRTLLTSANIDLQKSMENVFLWLNRIPVAAIAGALAVITLLLVSLSLFISIRIMERKEY